MPLFFPFESGFYSVRPGLRQLGGPATSVADFERYRREKLAARAQRETYLEHELTPATRDAASHYLAHLLTHEHPDVYSLEADTLTCALTGESVALNADALKQIPLHMCEDVAVVQVTPEREYLAAGHICLPSSWRLEDKIGRPFIEVHRPVPGMQFQGMDALVRSLASRGPYERYAWGVTNFDVLDQRADVHAEVQPQPLYVRVERQTLHPLPECSAWLFLIHPSNTPVEALTHEQRVKLADAIESMTEEQALYKGLATTQQAVVERLRSDA